MADTPPGIHPGHRPPYINIVPLVEMLRVALGVSGSNSKVLERVYAGLVEAHGPEIDLLLNADVSKLEYNGISENHDKIAKAFDALRGIIRDFRENKIEFKPGGGGTFGELVFDA